MGPVSFIGIAALGRPKRYGPFLIFLGYIDDSTGRCKGRPCRNLTVRIINGPVQLHSLPAADNAGIGRLYFFMRGLGMAADNRIIVNLLGICQA